MIKDCNLTEKAVIAVTISLRNPNPLKPELGESFTNQDVNRLTSLMYEVFVPVETIIEGGAYAYGEKTRMATVIFKKK